ncbi:immunodominant staphylococcal antigen IsaB family protein [Staphylococcus kloosii]|jgi:NAD+--asparagine ADP-ribosyltransferase|uniref:immunodominant staphylococcal antigen IsaB family protein n=1 Tax=Staphylococcus kloosii TaxID=29384 RepID=UPI00189D290A|nr:hypothetical protein [Staphylococcus kloosii]MBF7029880.1 hypothetical protein [Staphylococcus kloosii]
MNKTTKTIVATTVAFGTLFGVGTASGVSAQNNVAHAATTPYYTYHGYAGNDASFLLNKQFIDGVKYDNVTFNGVKITNVTGSQTFTKYDQTFTNGENNKSANLVKFKVKDQLTVKQLKDAYGSELEQGKLGDKSNTVYQYKPKSPGLFVSFNVNNNKVSDVVIMYGGAGGG